MDREQMILGHLPMVRKIAGRIAARAPRFLEFDDLVQAGTVGLIGAVDRYDPSRGVKFTTYAAPCIRGAILDELRAYDPRGRTAARFAREDRESAERFLAVHERIPTDHDAAAMLRMSVNALRRSRLQAQYKLVSLEAARSHSIPDPFLDALDQIVHDEDRAALAAVLPRLQQRDREVLGARYVQGETCAETGKRLGVTASRISQLYTQAISRLRALIRPQPYRTEAA